MMGFYDTELPETLPGENETETITRTRVRYECEECGEPAQFKRTWLLQGARTNPASAAYGKDDCSRYADDWTYACRKCVHSLKPPDGYDEVSTYAATDMNASIFLHWEEKKEGQ